MIPRRGKAWLRLYQQKFSAHWALGARILFCFAVGVVTLLATRQGNFDTRLALRGPQFHSPDIVLIKVSRDDILGMNGLVDPKSLNLIRSLKEVTETSDSFFWQPLIWEKAINQLVALKVNTIVITPFFSEETVQRTLSHSQLSVFQKTGIYWAAKLDADNRALLPGLATSNGSNAGVLSLRPDPDGIIRRFFGGSSTLPGLAVRVANHFLSGSRSPFPNFSHHGHLINFQGPRGTFQSYSLRDLSRNKIGPAELDGKIVILTVSDGLSHQVQTPVGPLTAGEVLANIVDNFIRDRWVVEMPLFLSILYLAFILLMTLWIIFEYPETAALVFLFFLATAVTTLSAAFFDLKAIWLPVQAPLASMLVAYVVISGYRLSESEKLSWQSEQELHYLSQVESLKNNFLSLISHDLKNPLAKIQGITDRLLSLKELNVPDEVKEDLSVIRRTSEELRQYITSILQLTRVEARDIKLTKEVCDLNAIVQDVLERIKPLAVQKNVSIETDLEPLFSMELDRHLISEVLLNLVENAIKYSDANSKIRVTTREIGQQVRVEVADEAGGIPEEEWTKIFDKFYRGTSEKTTRVTGTGLGLYLVKYFIELHGGSVFINSEMGRGTRIGFTLPLEAPEEKYAEFARPHR